MCQSATAYLQTQLVRSYQFPRQVTTNRYLCRNKYYGRSLNDEGLQHSLAQFFHNGVRLRTDIFPALLSRLRQLLTTIDQLDSFRFFTSSLLIIYDGLDESSGSFHNRLDNDQTATALAHRSNYESPPSLIDVRIIDFAHATHRGVALDSPVYGGPDDGIIFGLKNLISLMEELSKEE